jgi:1,4-dihydroxy-6-naphthoate synthase
MTSAYLAFKLCFPDFQEVLVNFDQIMDEVKKGTVDAGLIIHEGQLTYQKKGFHKIADMGEWWFKKTGTVLPMGVNAIRRDLPEEVKKKVSRQLKQSIQYSLDNREAALDYALAFGRGLSRDIADRFVGMWVNERTIEMGEEGKNAIRQFLNEGERAKLIPPIGEIEFVS